MAMMMVTVSLPLKADEAGCKVVLHDCDNAVKALQTENALQKQIISDEEDRFNTEHKELISEQLWKPLFLGCTVVIGIETIILVFRH